MAYFQSCKDDFASLIDEDYFSMWTKIDINRLRPHERTIVQDFHNAAAGDKELNPEVLLVQADGLFLKDIYLKIKSKN